ncbi:MAG TPA: GNAT family N-acetyltransferase [Actinomycetota bacterium]|nr:GNAT family N-acetyltransferase [Actinomycetota bacterium]
MSELAPKGHAVRRADVSDVESLLDLYEAVAAEGRYIGRELPVDRDALRPAWVESVGDPEGAWFVAEIDGELVGSASIQGRGVAHLGMQVARSHRGRGIGSSLLEASIGWARHAGAHKVALEVWPHNDAAIALYEKFGFEREGYLRKHWRRRSGELWDSVVMGLVLEEE